MHRAIPASSFAAAVGTAFVEIGDRLDDVGDGLFGVCDLQRPSAASMISRVRLESTTRPWRYDSSAASMPASSSGVSAGASSSAASTTYRPAGSSRSSGGTSLPFQVMTRARRGIPDILPCFTRNDERVITDSIARDPANPAYPPIRET